jgi:transcription elongation GreA/GreB family factor
MAKPQVTIINADTGEEITRDANTQEMAQFKKDADNALADKANAEAKAAAKAAILDRIGLTADELKTILG